MTEPRKREPFSLSDQVKAYIKVFAPRPELRKMDTSVGNLVLKVLHGKDRFNADIKTENTLINDSNVSVNRIEEQELNSQIYCKGVNIALPADFRKEIAVLLLNADGAVVAKAEALADLGLPDLVSSFKLDPSIELPAWYVQEFYSDSMTQSNAFWVGNTIRIKSPSLFSTVRLIYQGYGKKYETDSYNNLTSISWIDFQYPELVALEIAIYELQSAGYQQEAQKLESMRNDALHAFLVDQAAQMDGASDGRVYSFGY